MYTREQAKQRALEINQNSAQSAISEDVMGKLNTEVHQAADLGNSEVSVNFGTVPFDEQNAVVQYLLLQGFTVQNISPLAGDYILNISWH